MLEQFMSFTKVFFITVASTIPLKGTGNVEYQGCGIMHMVKVA